MSSESRITLGGWTGEASIATGGGVGVEAASAEGMIIISVIRSAVSRRICFIIGILLAISVRQNLRILYDTTDRCKWKAVCRGFYNCPFTEVFRRPS